MADIQYNIKWNKKDYLTLGRAVAQFNKKINRLNAEEVKLYLPETLNYKDIKENILTRRELNRILKSLKRFSRSGAEELYKTKAGQEITKWEYKELGIQRRIAVRTLNKELQQLNIKGETGFSRVEMGSFRKREIESTLNNLRTLENKKGYEFERLSRRIKMLGTNDYTLRKAYIYQDNFMNSLVELKTNNPEFNKVFDYFNKIKNPITFFNTAQKSNALQDYFTWYKHPENYAGFETTEELSEYIINEYL